MPLPIKHIILADDDQDDVMLFTSAIEDTCPDLEVSIADNGVKLLSLLKNTNKPDCIFLDLNMPIMGGKECLVKIRGNSEFKNIPIIIVSTSDNKADVEYCLSNGANHYLKKPQTYTALLSLVEKLCDGAYAHN